ncbi:MAG: hypothetical protein ACYDEJ_00690 [Desulfitobacteriaceae bacterium]
MSLDQRTSTIVQISAAATANALPALRAAITTAIDNGISKLEIQAILDLVIEIQQQPVSHTQQLTKQLLREPHTKQSDHASSCSCNHCGNQK